MIRFWSICRNTFVQSVRQPVFTVLIVATFVALVIQVPLSGWTMGGGKGQFQRTDQLQMQNLGLATLLISGLLIAAFTASGVLTREIKDRTTLTVISKPIARGTFVLGKFAGVAAVVAVAYYICCLAFLLTVRHRVLSTASDPYDWPVIVLGASAVLGALAVAGAGNFLFNWSFTSALVAVLAALLTVAMGVVLFVGVDERSGAQWVLVEFGQHIRPQLLLTIGLGFMAVLVLVAVAIAASTRMSQVLTLLTCLGVYGVGLLHLFLFRKHADSIAVARVLGWLAPYLPAYDTTYGLTTNKTIPLDYVALASLYCVLYVSAVLAVAMALFQRRQLAGDEQAGGVPAPVGVLALLGRAGALGLALLAVEAPLALILARFDAGFQSALLEALQRKFQWSSQAWAILPALGTGALAAATWVLWGRFGRGSRWAYVLVLVAAGGCLVWFIASLPAPSISPFAHGPGAAVKAVAAGAATAVILLLLVLPKTRRHFQTT